MPLKSATPRIARIAVLVAMTAWLMGMSGSSGGPASEKVIPIPDQNYTVMVTDSRGAKAEARRFTWEGKVSFQGQFGNATVTLPFPKVKSIAFAPEANAGNPDLILAKITLQTGELLELRLDRKSKCYGETNFGTYEIFVRDISSLQFE